MATTLALLRHGLATGQGPDADLMPEGAVHVRALGRHLAAEGWVPRVAFTSPYRRARETSRIVLSEIAPDLVPVVLEELIPETSAERALAALRAHGLPDGPVLVVAHLPLLGLIALELTDDDPGFRPGTFAEIELAPGGDHGSLRRRIASNEL